jgi:hypothetical protein
MAWENDSGPVGAFQFYIFGGALYCWAGRPDANLGLYERTGDATWTYRNPAGDFHYICEWGGRIWAATLTELYHTANGTDWTLDYTITDEDPAYTIRSMNAYGSYLHLVALKLVGANHEEAHFYQRTSGGAWTADVHQMYDAGVGNDIDSWDIIRFGTYTYWSADIEGEGNLVKRTSGANPWANEPTISGLGRTYFFPSGGALYAASNTQNQIWRFVAAWALDLAVTDFPPTARLSEGVDGDIWFADDLGATGQLYVRSGGVWAAARDALADADVGGGGIQWASSTVWYIGGDDDIFREAIAGGNDMSVTGAGVSNPPQALDVDGDGDLLYMGIYDNLNNPIVVRANLPLVEDHVGTRIFNPGAGDSVNVKCTEYTGERVVVSGYFGNNEQTELSTDGGTTLSGIDPGTWAANRAQPISIDPNDDNHILLALDGLDDLVETEDAGTWTTLDAALPYNVSAMGILDIDPNEIVIARTDAGAALIHHSPNNGATWTDITGALDVTAGIAAVEVVA